METLKLYAIILKNVDYFINFRNLIYFVLS